MTKEQFSSQVLGCEDILFKVAMSMLKNEADAQDAMQTAVLKAYEKLGSLKHEEHFRTWLIRILINSCHTMLRQKAKSSEYTEVQKPSVTSPEETEVRIAVESLPMKLRQVVILYYSEQLTTKEIAAALHIPKGTVLSRLDKARRLLRLELE